MEMNKTEPRCPRHTLTPGNVSLFVVEASGMRRSRHDISERNPDPCDVSSSSTSCKHPSVSCAEARAPSASCRSCRVARSCSHICQNPSDGLGSHPLTLHLLGFFLHVRICFKLRQLKLMACEHVRALPN